MKLKTPEADEKSEIAGRMYEACDLRMAIEGGHLKNLDDVLAWSKEAESDLQALMELPVWVITEESCVDIKASIAHNQGVSLSTPVKQETDARIEGLERSRRVGVFAFVLAVVYAGVNFWGDPGPGALGKFIANLGSVTSIAAVLGVLTMLAGVQLRLWQLRQERKRQGQ